MKAVILCGGKGRRLGESTEYMPKPLVEVGGRPILWHILKIYSEQGVKDFILCLGYKGQMIKDYFLKLEEMNNDFVLDLRKNKVYHLSDTEGLDITITFVDTGQEVMTGARIARIQKYIGTDEDFFMTYGDGVADIDLRTLYEHHKKMGKIATLTAVHPVYWYGLTEINDGMVIRFDEKPDMKDYINGGFMVFNKRVFDYLSTDPSCILEQEPLRRLASEGQLAGYVHQGFWKAVDTQKDLDDINRIYKESAPWVIWKKEDVFSKTKQDFSESNIVYHQDRPELDKKSDELNRFRENEQ